MALQFRVIDAHQYGMRPLFSIIIPLRVANTYLLETKKALVSQTLSNFELIVVDDKMSGVVSPSIKRNLGASRAKGLYLAFLDDDSYPDPNWLNNAQKLFESDPSLAAVCGPQLTPPSDDWTRQATGLVVGSVLGSGGAGLYRNRPQPARYVDDYPSVNLIVKKTDFNSVSGFDTHHWPGEDTLLCLTLTHTLGKRILYHPSLVVYHHRRRAPFDYLTQIGRYALHRGHFTRIYPQNSLRLGYLMPSLFLIYLLFLVPASFLFNSSLIFLPLGVYFLALIISFVSFLFTSPVNTALLAAVTIVLSHLYYGLIFPLGFVRKQLSFKAHSVNLKSGSYQGG